MPRIRVAAPPIQAAAHGLLAAMLPPTDVAAVARWEIGFEFEPPFDVDDSASPGPDASMDVDALPAVVSAEPFIVYRGVKTRAFAGLDADLERRATEVLAASAGVAFERHLWTNAGSVPTPYLTPATTPLSATAVSHTAGLGALIAHGADIGRLFIHTTPQVALRWLEDGLIREVTGGGARTLNTVIGGHVVVVGLGYVGTTGIATTPSGTHWAIATGVVVGELGEVMVNSTIDRSNNMAESIAQQTARIYFDPATLAGVPITI